MAGMLMAGGGLLAVNVVVDGVTVALPAAVTVEAVEAAAEAWRATTGTDKQRVGAAGEAAARVIHRWVLRKGDFQRGPLDFNDIMKNFNFLDDGDANGLYQVKVKDVLSPKDRSPISDYAGEFEKFFNRERLDDASKLFDKHRRQIQQRGGWPADLSEDASPNEIGIYLRDQTRLVVPNDHLDPVRKGVHRRLLAKVQADPQKYGLAGSDAMWVGGFVQDMVVKRVTPLGIDSAAIRGIVGIVRKPGAAAKLLKAAKMAAKFLH